VSLVSALFRTDCMSPVPMQQVYRPSESRRKGTKRTLATSGHC